MSLRRNRNWVRRGHNGRELLLQSTTLLIWSLLFPHYTTAFSSFPQHQITQTQHFLGKKSHFSLNSPPPSLLSKFYEFHHLIVSDQRSVLLAVSDSLNPFFFFFFCFFTYGIASLFSNFIIESSSLFDELRFFFLFSFQGIAKKKKLEFLFQANSNFQDIQMGSCVSKVMKEKNETFVWFFRFLCPIVFVVYAMIM